MSATTAVAPGAGEPGRSRLAQFFIGRTLDECQASRRDNILQLRLLAAVMVIMGHTSLAGRTSPGLDFVRFLFPRTYVHVFGLCMFFVISGFLITLSFERRPDLARFLRARALRILPALTVCVFALAFVIGPIVTNVSLTQYFALRAGDSPYAYALGSASLLKVGEMLPGVFTENPMSHLVNGPLWTIPVEAMMYLFVAGAGVLRLLRFRWLTSVAIAAVFAVLILWPMYQGRYDYLFSKLTVIGFFGAGAIACLLRRYIPVSTGLMIAIFAAALLARTSTHALPFVLLLNAYFVFWFAYVPRLPAIPGDVDLSYGTYLWSWPIEQCLVIFGGIHDGRVVVALTIAIVLPLAALSWHFIEKPALRLKDRFRRTRSEPAAQAA
jgi:peptidoglycan/LPS O-acetylase OafA/YrhL